MFGKIKVEDVNDYKDMIRHVLINGEPYSVFRKDKKKFKNIKTYIHLIFYTRYKYDLSALGAYNIVSYLLDLKKQKLSKKKFYKLLSKKIELVRGAEYVRSMS